MVSSLHAHTHIYIHIRKSWREKKRILFYTFLKYPTLDLLRFHYWLLAGWKFVKLCEPLNLPIWISSRSRNMNHSVSHSATPKILVSIWILKSLPAPPKEVPGSSCSHSACYEGFENHSTLVLWKRQREVVTGAENSWIRIIQKNQG